MDENEIDDNTRFKLSEQGEAYAVDKLIGGQDSANVVAGFMTLIRKHGNAINDNGYEPTMTDYFQFVFITKAIKYCQTWENLVKFMEELLEAESDWFKTNPHS